MDLRHLRHLERLTISDSLFPNLCLPPSIQYVYFNGCDFLHEDAEQTATMSFPPLENLHTLHFSVDGPYPQFILQAALATKPGKLESFSFLETYEMGPEFVRLIETSWVRDVKVLGLFGPGILDTHSQLFIRCFPALRTLCIDDCDTITSSIVSAMIEAPNSQLEEIHLQGCDQVSRDIIPWAKERSVEVTLKTYDLIVPGDRSSDDSDTE